MQQGVNYLCDAVQQWQQLGVRPKGEVEGPVATAAL